MLSATRESSLIEFAPWRLGGLNSQSSIFNGGAGIHHNNEARLDGLFGGVLIVNAKLGPQNFRAHLNCLIGNRMNEFKPAKNIHDFYFFGNRNQIGNAGRREILLMTWVE